MTVSDTDAYVRAERARDELLTSEDGRRSFPTEPILVPKVQSTSPDLGAFFVHLQVTNYGITDWGKLFNPRQSLALRTFVDKVKLAHDRILEEGADKEYAKAITTYLGIAVDRLADRNSVLVRWDGSTEGVGSTFSRQALSMVWDYCELNPFSGSVGCWDGALDWIVRVIEAASRLPRAAEVRQGTATALPYEDGSMDLVATDPPYYDSVPYADLSDFFYVWMKRSLGTLYPELFSTPLTPKSQEIIQNDALLRRAAKGDRTGIKDRSFFQEEMSKAFSEISRVPETDRTGMHCVRPQEHNGMGNPGGGALTRWVRGYSVVAHPN